MCLHSVLPAIDQLLCSPPSFRGSFSVPTDLIVGVGTLQVAGTSLLLQLPPRGTGPDLHSLLFFFFFTSVLPSYREIPLVLSGVLVSLPVFSRCSVRVLPFIDVFLM